jgi:CheY-like chemotaxis protein
MLWSPGSQANYDKGRFHYRFIASAWLGPRGVNALHQPPRITVVNDNEQFLALMHDLLTQDGYDVRVVDADSATIEAIADTDPDLLVIDLRLGSLAPSGWDVLLMARAHEPLRDIPVILCSADIVELRARTEEMSAIADVHVLEKPFRIEQAEELLRRLLEREPPPRVIGNAQPEPT